MADAVLSVERKIERTTTKIVSVAFLGDVDWNVREIYRVGDVEIPRSVFQEAAASDRIFRLSDRYTIATVSYSDDFPYVIFQQIEPDDNVQYRVPKERVDKITTIIVESFGQSCS